MRLKCPGCGNYFEREYNYHYHKRAFCSRECVRANGMGRSKGGSDLKMVAAWRKYKVFLEADDNPYFTDETPRKGDALLIVSTSRGLYNRIEDVPIPHAECYLKEARAMLKGKNWQGKNRCIKLAGDA